MSGPAKFGLFIAVTALWWLVLPWLLWRAVPIQLLDVVLTGMVTPLEMLVVLASAPVVAALVVAVASRLLRRASAG